MLLIPATAGKQHGFTVASTSQWVAGLALTKAANKAALITVAELRGLLPICRSVLLFAASCCMYFILTLYRDSMDSSDSRVGNWITTWPEQLGWADFPWMLKGLFTTVITSWSMLKGWNLTTSWFFCNYKCRWVLRLMVACLMLLWPLKMSSSTVKWRQMANSNGYGGYVPFITTRVNK